MAERAKLYRMTQAEFDAVASWVNYKNGLVWVEKDANNADFWLVGNAATPVPRLVSGAFAGFNYRWNSAAGTGDPGVGRLAIDGGFAAVAISAFTAANGNPDVSTNMLLWDNSTNTVKGILIFSTRGTDKVYRTAEVTGLTDNGDWLVLDVQNAAGVGSLTNNEDLDVMFIPSGNRGATVQEVLDALGVNSITISTSDPSGGEDGDIWFKVPVS